MDTIFQLPLFLLACLQLLIALFLLLPVKSVSLAIAQLLKKTKKSQAANAVILTLGLVLAGLLASCFVELLRKGESAVRADAREMVSTIDYLRAQVSAVLCTLNIMLLLLTRALADVLCAEAHSTTNLEAMKRQVKGLQAEYERVTKAGDGKGSSQDSGVSGSGETGVLKQKVDKLIQEKMDLQGQVDAAVKAKTTAEASVSAMKSQLKGFDTHMDKLMEENAFLKRKLVGHGDETYRKDVEAWQEAQMNKVR